MAKVFALAVLSALFLVVSGSAVADSVVVGGGSDGYTWKWQCSGNFKNVTGAASPIAACQAAGQGSTSASPPSFTYTIDSCTTPVVDGTGMSATSDCAGTQQYCGPYGCAAKESYGSHATGTKVKACAANAVASSGYYDVGASQGASPQLMACADGCRAYFDGVSPAGSSIVGGVKHWFAKGQYIFSGETCTVGQGGNAPIGQSSGSIPAASCAANQGTATMNGKTVCVDQGGDGSSPTPDIGTKATTDTSKTSTTNPDGSKTETETTTKTDGNGNKQVTVTTTTTKPDGSTVSNTTTTNPLPDSGNGQDQQKSQCEQNSSSAGCGGDPAAIGQLYAQQDKTMSGVLTGYRDQFMGSPIGSAVGNFFVVSVSGSCPQWSAHIPFIKADVLIDQFCSQFASNALAILKACILVAASFFAFRIAVE